jgi:hypothetical protein
MIVSYAGGMGGILTWLAAEGEEERVARVLVKGVGVAAALILLQGVLLP